jgi:hydrogenase-4 component B
MTPEQAVVFSILISIGGAVLTLLVSQNRGVAGWLSFLTTLASAVLIFTATVGVLTSGPSPHPATIWTMPGTGFELRFYVDGLSAIFLTLIAFIAVPAALYSIPYMRHYEEYSVARYYPNFLVFVAAMYGLVSTTDMMWFFFIFWQMMTLTSYVLIRFEHRIRANVRAANKYLIMMQIACVVAMIGAALITGPVSEPGLKYDFDVVSANLPSLLTTAPELTAFAFFLFLVGFGIKAGMWPFGQIWLPDAHPAAPSPVSSMLSGVMIKTGVYGIIRYFLWLVPMNAFSDFPLARWGMIVSILGTVTLFTGTMQALKQEQSKRLLAFHSIGQVGYILLGTGVCMSLLPSSADPRIATLAVIGICGALFHVINHGLFKGLLFLNAGSMLYATNTQDLNKLGGLMKYMPITAVTAIVASFSISGVPLFNGFASKWSIYVAAIQGGGNAGYLAVCAVIAILTSALTLASFIKFFGVSFLSRQSALVTECASKKKLEVNCLMQLPQILLAFVCILLGTVPVIAYSILNNALNASRQGFGEILANASPMASSTLLGLDALGGSALFAPVVLLLVLVIAFAITYVISKLGGASRREATPWLCGYAVDADCYRYSAHNFYGEIKRYFKWLGGMPKKSE